MLHQKSPENGASEYLHHQVIELTVAAVTKPCGTSFAAASLNFVAFCSEMPFTSWSFRIVAFETDSTVQNPASASFWQS
jgi:hypothetical protein